jgi:hypothetical protein
MDIDSTSEALSDLKFIGKIKKGEKINTKYRFVHQNDDFMTKLIRTIYYVDNRANTLLFIKRTVQRCFEILNYKQHFDTQSEIAMSDNIITDLKQVIVGIDNIKITYSNDISFCCSLDTICQHINGKLLDLNK